MPEAATLKRARNAKRTGKAPSTQAGEFVREEIHHVREGKHGARSAKQAIAIGLSKATAGGRQASASAGERQEIDQAECRSCGTRGPPGRSRPSSVRERHFESSSVRVAQPPPLRHFHGRHARVLVVGPRRLAERQPAAR